MQKLELTWIGKDKEPAVEPRILLHDSSKDYGDPNTENMLIHGDNLLALKALEQQYTGKVKCIYIDPPYNTGTAFEHYDDNLEHSIWLSLMKNRLEILKNLLSNDGLIYIQIDDNEQPYLRLLMDEVFLRKNFVNCIVVKMSEASGTKMAHVEKRLPKLKEYILVYKKENVKLNELRIPKEKWDDEYKTVITNISDEELAYIHDVMNSETYTVEEVELCQQYLDKAEYISLSEVYKNNGLKSTKDKVEFNYKNANRIFQTVSMGGGTTAQINESRNSKCKNIFFIHQTTQNKLYIIKGDYDLEKRKPRIQVLFAQDYLSYNPCDLWTDIKTTGLDNEGAGVAFKNSKKPEHLIERIISMSTNPGDLVLDSFLGSGTTAAVAHKMGRRYIGIELGNHCYTHCIPRLNSVIDGTDKGGISKKVNWQGGGGYKFYELAPSLIEKDKYGNPVISNKYNSNMLIAAIAKLNGYNYSPNPDVFWKQGYSQDKSYIYVTTNYMDSKMLDSIYSDLGMMETLLICAPAFDIGLDKRYDNIQVKKIPQSVLDKCEYGVDNYNLNVVDIPIIDEEEWEDD